MNNFVSDFKVETPTGRCGFQVKEDKDYDLGKIKIVALHNCLNQDKYGVKVTLYLKAIDLANSKIEKVYSEKEEEWNTPSVNTDFMDCN